MHRRLAVLLWLIPLTVAAAPQSLEDSLRTGDIVFHTSRSQQSAAIQAATHSPLSHVGVVEVTVWGTWVVEAVQPVKRTPFARWRARGAGGRLLVLRHEGLSGAQRSAVLAEAKRHLGKPYDARFSWDEEALYCSELVHKAFLRGAGVALGRMERLGSLDLSRIGAALAERYDGRVPRELEVLTPASLAQDVALRVVHSDFPSSRGR